MTSQQTCSFRTLWPCLNLCVFKKRENGGQVPGVEEWTQAALLPLRSQRLTAVVWPLGRQACGGCRHPQGLVPPAQMFVLKARNLPIPMECLGKCMGTAFLTCVQTDWSAPCCPISRIAVLSLLKFVSQVPHLKGKAQIPNVGSWVWGSSLGSYGPWSMAHQLSDLYFRVKCYRLHRHHIELRIHAKEMLSLSATNAAHFPFNGSNSTS